MSPVPPRPAPRPHAPSLAGLALALVGTGCVEPGAPLDIPAADAAGFRATVYPVLLADCGFPACHGDPRRFFSVYGPGRTRLDPRTPPYDPATPDELALSYTRARSMLLGPAGVRGSLLVRKPLARAVGGAGHEGDDPWGGSVYASLDDPRFRAIYAWATAKAAP